MIRTTLILLTLVACKGSAPGPAAPATPATPAAPAALEPTKPTTSAAKPEDPKQACEAKAQRFGARLSALVKDRPGLLPDPMPDGLALPEAPAAAKPVDEQGVVVVITKDGKVMAGDNTVSAVEGPRLIESMFFRRLAEAAAMERGPKKPWALYVWADKGAKASVLATVLKEELTGSTYWKVRLLVGGTPAASDAEELAKPSVKKVVDALPKGGEPELFARAKAMRDAGDPCNTLPMAYAKSETESGPANMLASMADKLPAALVACGCDNANWDFWQYWQLRLFGAFAPSPKWIELPKLSAKDKRTVAELAI